MDFTDRYSDAFSNSYQNDNSILRSETLEELKLNIQSDKSRVAPTCHLDFSALGKMDFDWIELNATSVNYKLFHKLRKISNVVKQTNNNLISTINELKCCGMAKLYNNNVVPIFDWLLSDFLDVLIDLAKISLISYQGFKTIVCLSKPIPGNPWLGDGGIDWLNPIYSFMQGFEAITDWLLSGNILDILLNPLEDINNKIHSCVSSSNTAFDNPDDISNTRLKLLLESYESEVVSNISNIKRNEIILNYEDFKKELNSLIGTRNNKLIHISSNNILDISSASLNNDLIIIDNLIIELSKDKRKDDFEALKNNKVVLSKQDLISSAALVEKTIDQVIIDRYDPSCSCLTGLLGISAYKEPEFVTLSTFNDLEKLSSSVHWGDKDIWLNNMEAARTSSLAFNIDALSEVFISKENIAIKYSDHNSSIDRDNLRTLNSYIDTLYTNYKTLVDNPFTYYNLNGVLINSVFDIVDATNIYTDTFEHQTSNINTIFELNEKRRIEIEKLNKEQYLLDSQISQLETRFSDIWNIWRRETIKIVQRDSFLKRLENYDPSLILNAHIKLNKLGSGFILLDFISKFDDSDLDSLKSDWVDLSIINGKINSRIEKLENLINLDNVVIQIVSREVTKCDCNIICLMLQWVLDLILSSTDAILKTIASKLADVVMNEHTRYILDLIYHYAQCALDVSNISKNIAQIDNQSQLLKGGINKVDKMQEYAYCESSDYKIDKLSETLYNDQVILSQGAPNNFETDDTIIPPNPTYGTIHPDSPESPSNSITQSNTKTGVMDTGKSIPRILFDCAQEEVPYIEVNIEPLNVYSIMIVFKPSDYIMSADVISTTQIKEDVINDTISSDVQSSIEQVEQSNNIIKKAELAIINAAQSPIIKDVDCTVQESEILKLCSLSNLYIDTVKIYDGLDPIDNTLSESINQYGEISDRKVVLSGQEIYETIDGVQTLIEKGSEYYTYEIRDNIIINNDSVVTENVFEVPLDTNTVKEDLINIVTSYSGSTKIRNSNLTEYSFDIIDGLLYQTNKHTSTITTTDVFVINNLEIMVKFRNSVNYLDVRFIFDVVYEEAGIFKSNYQIDLYEGPYTDVVEIGDMDGNIIKSYNISHKRLFELSQNLLTDNYLLSSSTAVEETVELANDNLVETDPCLLSNTQKEDVVLINSQIDNLIIASEVITNETDILSNLVIQEDEISSDVINIPDLKKSIPLLVLNKEKDILIQIVDRKIYLQFAADSLFNSTPYIIEHDLVAGDIYAMIFKTNLISFDLSLITPTKKKFTISGMSPVGVSLLPSNIGCSADYLNSFCGEIIDIIISKSGNLTTEYYNRSLLSYIPRQAQILFDFSVSSEGRIYNTLAKSGTGFIKDTDGYNFEQNKITAQSNQKVSFVGDILSNEYYQVLSNGYMDNFFCKSNLINMNFTISLWLYSINNKSSRNIILSDDVLRNYIYYDAVNNKIIIDFYGADIVYIFEALESSLEWCHLTLSHNLYNKTYTITTHLNDTKSSIIISTNTQFNLMSIGAEYDDESRNYINRFSGLLSTISIFFLPMTDEIYDKLHLEQKIIVNGMEDVYS